MSLRGNEERVKRCKEILLVMTCPITHQLPIHHTQHCISPDNRLLTEGTGRDGSSRQAGEAMLGQRSATQSFPAVLHLSVKEQPLVS